MAKLKKPPAKAVVVKRKKPTLPRKLSALLRLAVSDARKVEKMKTALAADDAEASR